MTKDGLVAAVQKVLGSSKAEASRAVDAMFDAIVKSLRGGEEVKVSGFGTFRVKMAKAREARNPRTGAVVHVPASKKPRFTPAKALKDAVK
jgi:DNA-binding protein HU-beta